MSSSAALSAHRWVDPAALMRIRSLELRARVVAEGLWKGLHRSPMHGFSVEFSEYRPYTVGDDLRHVDWKVAGRTERYFVKRYEDETNLRCQLVVDRSGSMGYGSGGVTKADYAATLAATLGLFLMKQGDAVGLTTFAEGVEEHLPARNRPGHLRRVMQELERTPVLRGTGLGGALGRLGDLLRRRGVVCVISDMLAPVEALGEQLGVLGAMGQDVALFQVLDRGEVEWRGTEAVLMEDLETGATQWVQPELAREGYERRFAAHQAAVQRGCEAAGVEWICCVTDEPLDRVLFDWISRRQRKGGRLRR